jgi:hypothetical protein
LKRENQDARHRGGAVSLIAIACIIAGAVVFGFGLFFAFGNTPDFLAENKFVSLKLRGTSSPGAPATSPVIRNIMLIATVVLGFFMMGGGLLALAHESIAGPTPRPPGDVTTPLALASTAVSTATVALVTTIPAAVTAPVPSPSPTETETSAKIQLHVPAPHQPRPTVPDEIDLKPDVAWQYGDTLRVKTPEELGALVRPYPVTDPSPTDTESIVKLKEGDQFIVNSSVRWGVGGEYWWYVRVPNPTPQLVREGWMWEGVIQTAERVAVPR